MKKMVGRLGLLFVLGASMYFGSCSKSGGSSSGSGNGNSGSGGSGNSTGSPLFPLAVNNSWNYKLRLYDANTGATIDSSYFTLSITGQVSVNGTTYYQFQNSVDPTAVGLLANTANNAIGSIDSAYGINAYTFFTSGGGDSTQSVDSWSVTVSGNGSTCMGTDKLYAHYADTTLINLDGTTYTQSIKNVIVGFDCSGNKTKADVYFIKQGVGLVRLAQYTYGSNGQLLLQSAWVLESESIQQ